MGTLSSFLRHTWWQIRGLKVYALVGKSGTGKSFRAQLIAHRHRLSHIIDDGLLIRGGTIVAGMSAKNAKDLLTATRIAVFEDPDHRAQVRAALEAERLDGILVLGTSRRMVHLVCDRLGLPPPDRIIAIEEVASEEELEAARQDREKGRHVIPVPALEVRRNYAELFIETIKILISEPLDWLLRRKRWEKTVVRPNFVGSDSMTITKTALRQMILHCIDEYDQRFGLLACEIKKSASKYRVNLSLSAPYGLELHVEVSRLQAYIKDVMKRYAGIELDAVNVQITRLI